MQLWEAATSMLDFSQIHLLTSSNRITKDETLLDGETGLSSHYLKASISKAHKGKSCLIHSPPTLLG